MNATAIIAIPLDEPERLFSASNAIETEYHALAKQWHPDHNASPEAGAVFDHIVKLRAAAQAKATRGTWETPGRLELLGIDGKTRRIHYLKKHEISCGKMYVARTKVAFIVGRANTDLFDNAIGVIANLRYETDAMRKEMARYFPKLVAMFETVDAFVLVVEKTEELVLLKDLIDYVKGALDPRHVAWILSSLYNIACYLEWAKLTHNDISPESYFISPPYHSGALLGGWWYATKDRMVAVPQRTAVLAPPGLLARKKADTRLDLELIRAIGRALIKSDAPAPMRYWLGLASDGSALREYMLWQKVLTDSFGPRRFLELPIKASAIYAGV